MTSIIWSGGADASDVFLLIAVVIAAVAVVLDLLARRWDGPTLVAAALGFVALGLLAI